MGKLTTHILDTAAGKPAVGVRIRLYHAGELIPKTVSNGDGRCDGPLLVDPQAGEYEIVFSMGRHFQQQGVASPFLDEVPWTGSFVFKIDDAQWAHVSTYG